MSKFFFVAPDASKGIGPIRAPYLGVHAMRVSCRCTGEAIQTDLVSARQKSVAAKRYFGISAFRHCVIRTSSNQKLKLKTREAAD
jgi:hypothetical protein